MNKQGKAHPVTQYDREYKYRDTIGKHLSQLRQMYLDSHCMSVTAQERIHNDPQGTIEGWKMSLPGAEYAY